jgi:hypothetical protein
VERAFALDQFGLPAPAACWRSPGEFTMNKKPELLELTMKIKIGRHDPDALVRLLIKQHQELLSAADAVECIPPLPMEWLRKTGF